MKPEVGGQAITVVLADDDASFRLLLRRVLENEGYLVMEASDGEEALRICETNHPDLVLLDAIMPDKDGFATCSELQTRDWARRVPVLMLTGLDDEQSIERAFSVGAFDYITKPVNMSVLKQRVRRMLFNSQAEQRMLHLAYHDPLTGLPNRHLLMDRLEQAIMRARRSNQNLAVMFMDLDRFKLINDSLGHDAGDRLLKTIAARLEGVVRRSDTVARLGGDEFTVILEGLNQPQEAAQVAHNILEVMARDIDVEASALTISGSIGIATFPRDGETVGALLKNADIAMYRAKELGRANVQFYTEEMSAAALRRLHIENGLRRGLARGEFRLHYQPKYQIDDNRLLGMEALLRWDHPEEGLLLPGEFISVAEETGIIVELGEWVIRTACEQFKAWQQNGHSVPSLAINLSTRQCRNDGLVEIIGSALAGHQLEPAAIQLEFTEVSLMHQMAQIGDCLEGLHGLGVKIAIDDFGSGCSSLNDLKRFPIDIIKVDGGFVHGLPGSSEDQAIVRAIIGLARGLDLDLVAEGVETAEQAQELQRLGCHQGQGHYWHRPAESDQLFRQQHA